MAKLRYGFQTVYSPETSQKRKSEKSHHTSPWQGFENLRKITKIKKFNHLLNIGLINWAYQMD